MSQEATGRAQERSDDHDLLIRIDQNVQNLGQAFRDLKESTNSQLATLWKEKAPVADVTLLRANQEVLRRALDQKPDKEATQDHERRLRNMEKLFWKISGAAVVIEILLHLTGFLK